MNRLEYLVASVFLRLLGAIFSLLPARRGRVVLATARTRRLEGNLLFLHRAIVARRPDLDVGLLLEPYRYGLAGKLAYLVRLIRGVYELRTAGLFIVDNAYFPIHVAPHGQRTTVVQVWHAAGALKRFGVDIAKPLREPEASFLHRYYDYVVTSGDQSRAPWAAAFRTPLERVLPLGSPRTDFFFDTQAMAAARERMLRGHPSLAGRRVILYAPTFRGRGKDRWLGVGLDGARLRAALPAEYALLLKTHPNVDPASVSRAGFDVVADPGLEINELFTLTDVFVTDYSSSIFEYALLRRPLVLLVGDLAEYEVDPGLYLDYRTEMIGTLVADTEAAIAAILEDRFDLAPYEAFIAHHMDAADGHASARFVERFLGRSSH